MKVGRKEGRKERRAFLGDRPEFRFQVFTGHDIIALKK
jgi:hypothetical protein